MTENLQQLEMEVEASRAKLASELATLASPQTLSGFKNDIKHEVLQAKDAMIESTKSAVTSGVQQLVDDLKARALANPTAAVAIGAGIAWRLFQRPPVATALIGVGLYSLWRTEPSRDTPYMGLYDEDHGMRTFGGEGQPGVVNSASEAFDAVKEQTQKLGSYAGDAVRQAAAEIREKTSVVADQASRLVHDARDATGEIMGTTVAATSQASDAVSNALRNSESRDALLLRSRRQSESLIIAGIKIKSVRPNVRYVGQKRWMDRY